MNLTENRQIMVPGRWAIVIIILTASGIFGAGGWATWAFQTLTSISDGMKTLKVEVRESRVRMEERVSKLEHESKQIKFCIRMMETSPQRVDCVLE